MEEANLRLGVVQYSTMVDACARVGQAKAAVEWVGRMEAARVKPNRTVLNSVVNSFARAGLPEGAANWLKGMRARSIEPDVISYTIAISACTGPAPLARADLAEQLFRDMLRHGHQPDGL